MKPYSQRFPFTWKKKSFTRCMKEPWSVMAPASLPLATLQPDKRMFPLPYKMCYLPQQLKRAFWSAQVPHENTEEGKGTMQMEPETLKPTMWWGIEREMAWGTELSGLASASRDRFLRERFGEYRKGSFRYVVWSYGMDLLNYFWSNAHKSLESPFNYYCQSGIFFERYCGHRTVDFMWSREVSPRILDLRFKSTNSGIKTILLDLMQGWLY